MLWQPTGCCCFSRRTGSLILASLSIVCAVFGILNVTNVYLNHEHNVKDEVLKLCEQQLQAEDVAECTESAKNFVFIGGLTVMMIYAIQVILSSLLIRGISKNNTCLMIPYMLLRLIYIVISILVGAGVTIALIVIGEYQIMGVTAVVMSCYIFLETYFLLVIHAHYLQMKRDSGYDHVELEEEGNHLSKCELKKAKDY